MTSDKFGLVQAISLALIGLLLGCWPATRPDVALALTSNGGRTTTSNIQTGNILDNISGLLFNTVNSVLDTTHSLVGLKERSGHADNGIECRLEHASDLNSSCLPDDPDAGRTVPEIIRSRGFQAEELEVVTDDGYILVVHRIVNPLVTREQRAKLRPVLLQHGLMTSSVDWVINSMGVRPRRPKFQLEQQNAGSRMAAFQRAWARPARSKVPQARPRSAADSSPMTTTSTSTSTASSSSSSSNGLGLFLANEGFDVFLANSRGNAYSRGHTSMSSWSPSFWDFTFDELIKFDLPAMLRLVQEKSGRQKVAYVGHSQGTAIMLGLLSDKPEYADVVEPVILLAPVAFVGNVNTPARYFASYTPIFQHVNMRFGTSSAAVRYLAPIVCGAHQIVRRELCQNVIFLSSGINEDEFDPNRLLGYLSHLPSGTSMKNLAHYGQEVNSQRFAHFDHGKQVNLERYGQPQAPDYQLTRIRSKSLVLFTSDTDWLSTPKDLAKLRAQLRVKPYKVFNMTQLRPKWSHMDYMYGKSSGQLVNSRILEVLREFDGDNDDDDDF